MAKFKTGDIVKMPQQGGYVGVILAVWQGEDGATVYDVEWVRNIWRMQPKEMTPPQAETLMSIATLEELYAAAAELANQAAKRLDKLVGKVTP